MTPRPPFRAPGLALLLLAGTAAAGAERDDGATPHRDAAASAREGDFLPYALAARIGDRRVLAVAVAGWDATPGRGATYGGFAEAALGNRIAIRGGGEFGGPPASAYAG